MVLFVLEVIVYFMWVCLLVYCVCICAHRVYRLYLFVRESRGSARTVVFCTCPLCVIVLLCFSFATFIRCTADMMLPLLERVAGGGRSRWAGKRSGFVRWFSSVPVARAAQGRYHVTPGRPRPLVTSHRWRHARMANKQTKNICGIFAYFFFL